MLKQGTDIIMQEMGPVFNYSKQSLLTFDSLNSDYFKRANSDFHLIFQW